MSPVNSNLLVDSPIVDIVEKKYYDIAYNAKDLEKQIMKNLFKKKGLNFNVKKIKKKIFNYKKQKKLLTLLS